MRTPCIPPLGGVHTLCPPPPPQVFEATGTLTATTLRNASAPIAEAVSFEAYQRMQLPADEVCAC